MSSLKEKATKGVIWSSIEQFSVQGMQFVIALIIARLIAPSEYGLIAMLQVFLVIANVFIDSGFSNALIQKQSRTQTDFSTVFYFNIAIAIICYIAIYFSAPYIAEFYRQPQLEVIARVVGLTLIINSAGAIQRSVFAINMNFKTTAKISLTSVIISGSTGIYMAYTGHGVWSLVGQSLSNAIILNTLLWICSSWRPSFKYSWESFRGLFAFGSKLLLSGLMHTVHTNLYTLVIGRKYNANDVGLYNRANSMAQFTSLSIMTILTKVLYPALCQIQDDQQRLSESFNQYLRMACFIVFPIAALISALSYPIIELVLTEKWMPAAPLLQILAIAYMWTPIMIVNNNILNVKGRSDYFLKAEIIKKVIAIGILLVTMPFGLVWLCTGVALYSFVDMAIIIYFSKKVINTGYASQIKQISPLVLIAVIMGLTAWSATLIFQSLWLQLIIGTTAATTLYVGLALMLNIKEIKTIKEFALSIAKRR